MEAVMHSMQIGGTLLGLLAFGSVATPTAAETCGSYDSLRDQLRAVYQEQRAASGITKDGQLLEIYASDENGTWTILVTAPNGPACLVTAGDAWRNEGATDELQAKRQRFAPGLTMR
ncbi:MAG: hypothetical protein ACREDZ_06090 [Kiloniellales bacterium]